MATITVLGAGMMGSALCVPLVDRGHRVRLVGTHLDDDIIRSLRAKGIHPKLGLELPRAIEPFPFDEIERAMQGVELMGVGVSSPGVRWAGEQLARFVRPEVPIVMITKGLELDAGGLRPLPDVLRSCLSTKLETPLHPAAIAGPCIASELALRVPTCVVLAGRDSAAAERVAAELRTGYYHVWTSADVVGVEVCAALKNAYAMGIAFALGLHEKRGGTPGSVAMHNHESAVFAQSVVEMQRVVARAGGNPATAAALAGVGDLDVTCNGGRTGRFGRLLGLGLSPGAAIDRMQGATLECLDILRVMRAAVTLFEQRGVLSSEELPLLRHLWEVALDGAPVAVPFELFFAD
jgi:glycerol-3-phosphate dehydrogenase (NAD(P)+)